MYKSLHIQNYRCFEDLRVGPFDRFNLIAGKNNVGKTALLEALRFYESYKDPAIFEQMALVRGQRHYNRDEFLWDHFYGFNPNKTIHIVIENFENGINEFFVKRRQPTGAMTLSVDAPHLTSEYSSDPNKPVRFGGISESIDWELSLDFKDPNNVLFKAKVYLSGRQLKFERAIGAGNPVTIFLPARYRDTPKALAERFSRISELRKTSRIVEILGLIEPRLRDLELLQIGDEPLIHCELEGFDRLIPLLFIGEGVTRLLRILLAIPVIQDGVLLIDEIENGLHHSILKTVWLSIAKLAEEYNVQVFATTHSYECIIAAHEAFSEKDEYNFRFHRLEKVDGKIQAVTSDQETLGTALKAYWEVR